MFEERINKQRINPQKGVTSDMTQKQKEQIQMDNEADIVEGLFSDMNISNKSLKNKADYAGIQLLFE